MLAITLLVLLVLYVPYVSGFTVVSRPLVAPSAVRNMDRATTRISNRIRNPQMRLSSNFGDVSSALLSVGDYAAEIEGAVGSEIYGPIFKAGLFIFVSGLVSAVIAAFLISKGGSWDDLEAEFDRGKQAQLIEVDKPRTASDGEQHQATTIEITNEKVLDEMSDLDL